MKPTDVEREFSALTAADTLPMDATFALEERGFAVIQGLVPADRMAQLTSAYAAAEASAVADDIRIGSTSTKVQDFVNRGPEFDGLYVFPALLAACALIIDGPFKLSSFQSRTLRPGSPSQDLHVDVRRDSADFPLVGFILMVDEFRPDNGATRFVPGSHESPRVPADAISNPKAAHDSQVLACGSAGSLLIFYGSVWHGHSANSSREPRRSLQGAFIPRDGSAATDFAARMQSGTKARLGPVARYVLAL